jgi:hypothetical protein
MSPDDRISQRAYQIATREAMRLFRENCEEKWLELLDDAYTSLGAVHHRPGRRRPKKP